MSGNQDKSFMNDLKTDIYLCVLCFRVGTGDTISTFFLFTLFKQQQYKVFKKPIQFILYMKTLKMDFRLSLDSIAAYFTDKE